MNEQECQDNIRELTQDEIILYEREKKREGREGKIVPIQWQRGKDHKNQMEEEERGNIIFLALITVLVYVIIIIGLIIYFRN